MRACRYKVYHKMPFHPTGNGLSGHATTNLGGRAAFTDKKDDSQINEVTASLR